ncbi:MAG: hypothetical protein P8Y70_12825 [Candidatus Lokiarchaeota archaeon]
MISGFSIILDNDIIYCSNEKTYTSFEIILFIEKLIRSINPKSVWRLDSILLENPQGQLERILIKHIINNNENIFYCILGDFEADSPGAFKMLNEFYGKVESAYSSGSTLKEVFNNSMKKDMINVATEFIKLKYEKIIGKGSVSKFFGVNGDLNQIMYCGISNQGLPIISQLYDEEMLINLSREANDSNIELFTSNLSAKLATITMNTIIRTNRYIKEIHIKNMEDTINNIFILYGYMDGYSLDFIASGKFEVIKNLFEELRDKISKELPLFLSFHLFKINCFSDFDHS